MREVEISTYCNTSAAAFWSLRQDRGYDEWFASLDGQVGFAPCLAALPMSSDGAVARQISSLTSNDVTTQDNLEFVQRTVKLEFKEVRGVEA